MNKLKLIAPIASLILAACGTAFTDDGCMVTDAGTQDATDAAPAFHVRNNYTPVHAGGDCGAMNDVTFDLDGDRITGTFTCSNATRDGTHVTASDCGSTYGGVTCEASYDVTLGSYVAGTITVRCSSSTATCQGRYRIFQS